MNSNNKKNVDLNEQYKQLFDEFGKLSFLLETWAKLKQTGDCKEVAQASLSAAHNSCASLLNALEQLDPINYETDNI